MKEAYEQAVKDCEKSAKIVRETYPGSTEIQDFLGAVRRLISASRPAEPKPNQAGKKLEFPNAEPDPTKTELKSKKSDGGN
jgi:hypothetical protein